MDNRQNTPLRTEEKDNIDIVSFDRRKRAAEIIRNEDAEREKRRREQLKRRKAERIRQAKIARIKGYILLGVTALGLLCIVIGIITAAVKLFGSSDKDNIEVESNTVSPEETALMNDFSLYSSYIYTGKENSFLESVDGMISDITVNGASAVIPAVSNNVSEYGALSERYMFFNDSENYSQFRNAVKNTPIMKNGYVFSQSDSSKSVATGGYLYDTNTSFILAVANICLSEGSTAFLSETDTDSCAKNDISQGLTVSRKLEYAIGYLFDGKTDEGGIKYDAQYTSLCYIHTMANNGKSTGTASNRFTNFKLGYLDAYSNISFNRAMRALVELYNLQGQTDDANKYKAVADQNAAAFSEKFWDADKQRFVGCFDADGNAADYGFVFVNIEAVDAGMASDTQAEAIFSWLDGSRVIEGDTSTGADIYAFGFAPRNTTLAADDGLWDTHGGNVITSGNGGFGLYYQNGGASLSSAYYDICARDRYGFDTAADARISALINEYNTSGFAGTDSSEMLEISGSPLSGLAPVAIAETVFGLDTDGLHLTINPDFKRIPAQEPDASLDLGGKFGIKGVHFLGNVYNFLYNKGTLYVTSGLKGAVRLKLGGFEPNKDYNLIKVTNGTFSVEDVPLSADENGFVSVTADFGSDSYIKIELAQ